MRLPERTRPAVFPVPAGPGAPEAPAARRRRRRVVGTTLVAGAAMLAGTLAAPSGSAMFYALGLAAALAWIAGGLLSGPIPSGRPGRGAVVGTVLPLALGALLFGAFLAAKLIADGIPLLSGPVARVLARADAGPRVVVLFVALVNGVGEEIFFRGAVQSTFSSRHAVLYGTATYCLVTVATLNLALVAAAVVMGTVFALERRVTGGVWAPILTHLSWSALMLLFLPR